MEDTKKTLENCRYTVFFRGKGSNNKRAMSYSKTYRDFLIQQEDFFQHKVHSDEGHLNVIPFPSVAY